ncbi:MAG: nucleotidyltransferase domain-containing protein [Actinomycetota bacterium]
MASSLELGELTEQIVGVLDAQPVAFAYLFGSHARGDAGVGSDVDVAVHFVDGIDRASRFERCLEIGVELERRLRCAVDVVDLQESPIRLAGRVITERVIVVGMHSDARVRYETELFGPYVDFEYHARHLDMLLLEATARGER